jgi:putative serine protease PepD
MNRLALPLAVVLAAAVLVLAATGFTRVHSSSSSQATVAPAAAALALQQTFVAVDRSVSPSVVQISTASGLGSGIVFDRAGDIVTNDHVVSGSTSFTVTTAAGERLSAKLVGEFPADDLAVIKVNATNLRPATFADSSKLQVGDVAIAIGNPLGLASSVTQGIVSGLDRQESEGNGVTLQNTIQTSAAINPGNSGGALVDLYGRVIGIPTLAATDPELGSTASGIGFAIPSDVVTDIAGQIVKHGHVVDSHRAYLGVTIGDTNNGVYVSGVAAGSPAAKAGIAVGDTITAVGGKATATSDDLGTVLAGLKPGAPVKVALFHQDGTRAVVTVTLGELPGTTT